MNELPFLQTLVVPRCSMSAIAAIARQGQVSHADALFHIVIRLSRRAAVRQLFFRRLILPLALIASRGSTTRRAVLLAPHTLRLGCGRR
ncbi:hypothetical protein [Aurantiacibacter rhizosphaerae]|uniref:hypothetical protein n=1 Tax=Aurantiacibacter rhizosphaerae TaxID=2691582 RepID=UPI00136576F2|nr:hypothetical protein [Aurantiacibacter rhizosphaerae]